MTIAGRGPKQNYALDQPSPIKPTRVVRFERRDLVNVEGLLGQAHRNTITGEVGLNSMCALPDFQVVDLLKRPIGLQGTTEVLMTDKFLFKAYPLMYRTWIYHDTIVKVSKIGQSHDENGVLRHVLSQRCIDAPINGGRSSPLMYFVPLAIGSCLTGSLTLIVVTLVMLGLLVGIAQACSSPEHYRSARLWTSPLRVGYVGLVLGLLDTSSFLAIAGYIINLLLMLADFVTGDLAALQAYKLHCTYDIVKVLPGAIRIAVCHREGAFQWEDLFGSRGFIDEDVTGLGAWDRRHHLIAELGDLLIELRPLTERDWDGIADQYFTVGEPIPYLAVGALSTDDMASTAPSTKDNFAKDLFLEDM